MNTFGSIIKAELEKQSLLLRRLTAELDIDTPTSSKIERREKPAKSVYIDKLATILDIDHGNLNSLWLADQVLQVVTNKKQALVAFDMVVQELKTQGNGK